MPSFKDRKGNEWRVELDAPTIEEIRDDIGVDLISMERDPLLAFQFNPMDLIKCIWIICRDQAQEQGVDERTFKKSLPTNPPDELLNCVREAIISFFPSGRASHMRGVLSRFDRILEKLDKLGLAKMDQTIDSPEMAKIVSDQADAEISQMLAKFRTTGQNAGT